jgi:predicted SprT family Zn-dependent metalloprotease
VSNPTEATYTSLSTAYDYFNHWLFDNQLPPCLITMQRRNGSYGYFAGRQFANASTPEEVTDEIALNPTYFAQRKPIEVLSTLVHEMCHLWQHHFGKPSVNSYHNKQWAAKMVQVGLLPTATGERGGKQTGQKMTHLILPHGAFVLVAAKLQAEYPAILYHDRGSDQDAKTRQKKSAGSRTKYTCPGCGLNAWAKQQAALLCVTCQQPLSADGGEEPQEKAERGKTDVPEIQKVQNMR